jgi:hypothetical protein
MVRRAVDRKNPPPLVSNDKLHIAFERKMNLPSPLPQSFNTQSRETVKALVDAIPRRTVDATPEGFLRNHVTVQDIQSAKKELRSRRSAIGLDQWAYVEIMKIPNETLAMIFNKYAVF